METAHNADELRSIVKEMFQKMKVEIIEKISIDSVTHIKEDSKEQFQANLTMKPDGFIIGEIPNNDKETAEHLEIENTTQAYAKQRARIIDKAYLKQLLDRGS
jgi:hypothetical protein